MSNLLSIYIFYFDLSRARLKLRHLLRLKTRKMTTKTARKMAATISCKYNLLTIILEKWQFDLTYVN